MKYLFFSGASNDCLLKGTDGGGNPMRRRGGAIKQARTKFPPGEQSQMAASLQPNKITGRGGEGRGL